MSPAAKVRRRKGRTDTGHGTGRLLLRIAVLHELRQRVQLDVRRALVDRADLRVAVEALHVVVLREPNAAHPLDALARRALRHLRREQLGHRSVLHERLAVVLLAGRVVDHQPRGVDLHRRLRVLELHPLEVADRRVELLALEQVRHRRVHRALRNPHHLRRNADAALVQDLDRDLVPLAHLADHVLCRHHDVVEVQLRRRARADAQLVLQAPNAHALLLAAVHDEARDPLVALAGVHRRHHEEDVRLPAVRDEDLRPVQHVRVTLLLRARLQRERVAPARRLRQAEAPDRVLRQPRQVLRLLRRVRVPEEDVVHQRVLHVDHHRRRAVHARQLLDREDAAEERHPAALQVSRRLDAHQARLERLLDHHGVHLRRLVHLQHARLHVLQRKLADRRLQHLLVLRQRRARRWQPGHGAAQHRHAARQQAVHGAAHGCLGGFLVAWLLGVW
eukprot:CAMPEP_0176433120 /NCGR_PEP_ID=MMETSP0127-20121128/15816_1 /TAXON_ID=938130 /ORGANISM="Platyophrya macrostoma, Strain WH" /LENGTH=447 /DNA_ID=CAMNT_0017815453 /DNA_START=418 /DNA_END=1758 /DNA_ORIENTATION=+